MAKTKVNLSGLNKVLRKLQTRLDSRELKHDIGKMGVEYISAKARTGVQIEDKSKFKPLKKETIEKRKYLERYNTTHSTYSAKRSNLTLTGQLINALTYKVGLTGVTIFVKDSKRIPYKGKKKVYKTKATNKDIAGYQSEKGRKFVGIDDTIKNRMKVLVRRFIRRHIK